MIFSIQFYLHTYIQIDTHHIIPSNLICFEENKVVLSLFTSLCNPAAEEEETHEEEEESICNAKMTERIGVYFVEIESNHGKHKKTLRKHVKKNQSHRKKKWNVLFLPIYNNLKQRKTKLE